MSGADVRVGTGLQFWPVDASLRFAVRRAVALFRTGDAWQEIQANGMASDVSWTRSAARYAELYRIFPPAKS
jgi:starch synthase